MLLESNVTLKKITKVKNFIYPAALFLLLSSCSNNEKGSTTNNDTVATHAQDTIKNETGNDPSQATMNTPAKNDSLEIRTVKTDIGWGYDIYLAGRMYVHQPHIPAVQGNKGFDTEADAKKTASFVIYKIRNNIIPPSLTVKELDSLGVIKK